MSGPWQVAFLRAINVGGRRVTMDQLLAAVAPVGVEDAWTHIASGNVVFRSRRRPATLEPELEASLADALGFEVETFVRPATRLRELVSAEPFGTRAEAFRALRTHVMKRVFTEHEHPRRALAVISPDTLDGKTYCAANLAASLAQLGGRTLLVDADLRGPRLHQVFGLDNRSGLSNMLNGRADSQAIQQIAGVPSLFVLPAGATPPNPLELVERPGFGLLMRELAAKFDHVVVDTPAAVFGADASVIAVRCGAALVIARKDASRVALLQDLVGSLEGFQVRVAGAVMNEY